mmetsp:Transcript_15310/g.42347  ORF Transcript_15310/g.42347 Transcript_15310/m.42347 type:complete len:203 (-) Transcript_15310:3-611(-)
MALCLFAPLNSAWSPSIRAEKKSPCPMNRNCLIPKRWSSRLWLALSDSRIWLCTIAVACVSVVSSLLFRLSVWSKKYPSALALWAVPGLVGCASSAVSSSMDHVLSWRHFRMKLIPLPTLKAGWIKAVSRMPVGTLERTTSYRSCQKSTSLEFSFALTKNSLCGSDSTPCVVQRYSISNHGKEEARSRRLTVSTWRLSPCIE